MANESKNWMDQSWLVNSNNGEINNGTVQFSNGDLYEGQFANGKMGGFGTYTYKSGNWYTGDYKNGNRHGKGVEISKEGRIDDGYYKDGDPHGLMYIYNPLHDLVWEWNYENGEV